MKQTLPTNLMLAQDFSIELAQQLLDSDRQFPVDFDLAWQWLGYSRKDNAKRALLNTNISENLDYILESVPFLINEEPMNKGIQAHPKENIFLTIECLKMWAMMSNTSQGKQVRLYFLECEKIAKAASKPQPNLDPQKLANLRLMLTSVNPALVDGFIGNELLKLVPELAPQIKEAHKLLARNTIIPEELMTPTTIGKELGISAIAVNKLLVARGLQAKNPNTSKGSPAYLPTSEGKKVSELTMATGSNGDNTTYQHLKWFRAVLQLLK